MEKHKKWCRAMHKLRTGEPFPLTDGQGAIFHLITDMSIKRVVIRTTTQYGKSDVTSMALLDLATSTKEKILIVAPSSKQAGIIMGDVIDHIFDNVTYQGMIKYDGSLERLKSERSKNKITFRNGGEIFILTADAETVSKESKNLMGFGASVVVVDESSLIPDVMYSKILRMVGGAGGGKIIQLGNPFEKNHFYKAFHNKRYTQLIINDVMAIDEGRLTPEFLEEAADDMTPLDYMIFYKCLFPELGAEDALIPLPWIENAVNQDGCGGDVKQAGLDIARFGKDKTIYIFRIGGTVKALRETEQKDTMEVVGWVRPFLEKDKPEVFCIDVIGVGAGVYDRLDEIQMEGFDDPKDDFSDTELEPVAVGEAPKTKQSKKQFHNLRAQVFFYLKDLFKPDKATGRSQISIPNDAQLKKELSEIRYGYTSEKKRKIEAKEDMKKRLGYSPDRADALALAFWDTESEQPQMFTSED